MPLSTPPADVAATREVLRHHIATHLLDGPAEPPGDDESLLVGGLLDSLGVMELVAFVESEFGISVPPVDVTVEHFETIGALSAYIEARRAADV